MVFAGHGAAALNKKGIKMTETVEKKENGKNLLTAFVAGFKNMFDFKTRASKYDYWAFIFANLLLGAVVLGTCAVLSNILALPLLFMGILLAYYIYAIVETIAVLALTVRRLHDTNHSGKILWLPLVFVLGVALGTGMFQYMKNIGSIFLVLGIGLFAASTLVALGITLWIFILCLRKGQTEENRFGKPIDEAVEYNKFANVYIVAYLVINIAVSAVSFVTDNDEVDLSNVSVYQNSDTVDSNSNETAVVTDKADSVAENVAEPAEAETEARPENSAEVETPAVPMHESAE